MSTTAQPQPNSQQTEPEHGYFLFDALTGDPTISATKRAKRPDQTNAVSTINPVAKTTAAKINPFEKGNEHLTPPTLYQDADDWNVRVCQNKYPLLEHHEVIIHSPFADKDIEDLPHDHNVKIIRAYLNRVMFHNSAGREIILFNNRGGKAGASLVHPHSQIVAAAGFPGELEKEKEYALHYYNEHGSSYWTDDIQKMHDEGDKRLVLESPHFVLYVPTACRWSYELRLLPKKQRPNFGFIEEPEIQDFACMLKKSLIAYNILFDRPDRNFWIHSMRYDPYHWHVGFLPHLKVFGALELGAGIWVSDKATPEDAAFELRGAIKNANCEHSRVT